MKFAVDCMLGKLAKWLKILGFDVAYFPAIEDGALLDLTRTEGRTLLTRDTSLSRKARFLSHLFILSENWEEQVDQVLEHFGLRSQVRPHSRCIECNVPLKILPRCKARNLVTPFIFERTESFALCPACGRVYWKGTHFGEMELKIARLLKKTPP